MEESQLPFDRSRHALYTPKAKAVIQQLLARGYPPGQAAALWEDIQRQYVEYLKDEPALGGLALSAGVYDSILVFAYYVTVPDKPAFDAIQKDIFAVFMGGFDALGRIFDLNRRLDLRLAAAIFRAAMRKKAAEAERFPAAFHVGESYFDKEAGAIHYSFTQCPNAEFAKRHGLVDVLPLLCNCDYLAMRALHGALIRCGTCATGNMCDYCIVGDRHPLLDAYTLVTDENGLWRSQPAPASPRRAEK